jgi:hypothetical protein
MNRCLGELTTLAATLFSGMVIMIIACDENATNPSPRDMPANVEIMIDGGVDVTNDTVLRVSIRADNTHRMLVGLEPDLRDAAWENFDTV